MVGKAYHALRRVVLAVAGDGLNIIDPAIEVDESDLEEYRLSLWDPKHLKFYDGEQPTWWTLKPLTRRQKDFAEAITGSRAKAIYHVRCSLQAVENYLFEKDGSLCELPPMARGADGLLSEEWMTEVDFPERTLIGLWLMIVALSEGNAPFSRRSVKPAGRNASSAPEQTSG